MSTKPTVTEQIPEYLMPYIVQQDAGAYTAIDHASWRFILKISQEFFARHAHKKYRDGLRETGMSLERIPLITEMDTCLRAFGWRAVAVSGFIPPAVFMEFLSLGILPIARDMRQLDHLAYTPAPDIVHEAAGHAPIIADPEYAQYLRGYGELSRKAIYSHQDMAVYEAVRSLSDVKEDPRSTAEQVKAAQDRLDRANADVDYVSEATQLARMGWWTFEYGLLGSLDDPKIYGAGLLSSVGESFHCLSSTVKKVPFSLECIQMGYDITKPQPQLYVAKSFQQLTRALEEMAEQMAFRIGGTEGLTRAKKARTVTTAVLDSGVQVSGMVADFQLGREGRPEFLKFTGPTQLAMADRELEGQGPSYHREGFSLPLGQIMLPYGKRKSPQELTLADLDVCGFKAGALGKLQYISGILLEGTLRALPGTAARKIPILTFDDCRISRGEELFYDPAWGPFDLALGTSVISVFGGAADRKKYLDATGGFKQEPGKQKTNLTENNRMLNELYAKVRKHRESQAFGTSELSQSLAMIHSELEANYPDDWLLRLELLELARARRLQAPWEKALLERLNAFIKQGGERAELIQRGLK